MTLPTGKEFCAFLERNGWALARIKGSHHVYKKAGVNALLTVPVHLHQPLKRGLFASLLSMAGLDWPGSGM